MKFAFSLLLLSIFNFNEARHSPTRVVFSPLTKAAYLQAKRNCTAPKPQITFPLSKHLGRIIIQTTKGKKVFRDIVIDAAAIQKGHGEEESTTYTYRGYLSAFHCHLVDVTSYESEKWLLLTDSGQQIELWGEPIYSPDMRYIAAMCPGLEYSGGQPNSIQLLGWQDGTIHTLWSLEPKSWEPYQLCWASSNTLVLSKKTWTAQHQGDAYTYAKLLID